MRWLYKTKSWLGLTQKTKTDPIQPTKNNLISKTCLNPGHKLFLPNPTNSNCNGNRFKKKSTIKFEYTNNRVTKVRARTRLGRARLYNPTRVWSGKKFRFRVGLKSKLFFKKSGMSPARMPGLELKFHFFQIILYNFVILKYDVVILLMDAVLRWR